MKDANCFFTNEPSKVTFSGDFDCNYFVSEGCGKYYLDSITETDTANLLPGYNVNVRLNCASENIKLNEMGITPFWVMSNNRKSSVIARIAKPEKITFKVISDYINVPISHSSKSNNILIVMAEKLSTNLPFTFMNFNKSDMYKLKINDPFEFLNWLIPLSTSGLIEFEEQTEVYLKQSNARYFDEVALLLFKKPIVKLTPLGWGNVEQSYVNGNQAFIAMAFTDREGNEVDKKLSLAIKDACFDIGWEAKAVNEEEHNDGIMDKVISLINKSRFVIAELTHQKTGVYYEAGYAKGLGLPVIHIVKNDELKKCHFDVQHLNLIAWSSYEDLKEKLKNRIEATTGGM